MRPVYAKDTAYDLLVPYVNWCFRRMFRNLEFQGLENIPRDGAVIFSPNHVNTLLDALAVLSMMGNHPVVFAARADIFRKPAIARILNFLRIMPINRMRDGVDALAGNEKTFRDAVDSLNAGIPFCIFPEGRHSQEPGLLPLRKGIARIAMMAESELERPVYIVPVGLVYEDYVNFRTSLKVNVGEPMPIAGVVEEEAPEDAPEENLHQRRARKILQNLAEKMRGLIANPNRPKRAKDSLFLRIIRVPFIPFAGLILIPAFGIIACLKRNMADKAFLNSIRYGICYLINPLLVLLIGLVLLLCGVIPWWIFILIPLFSPFAPEIWYGGVGNVI